MTHDWSAAWRRLLPDGVACSAGPAPDDLALSASELASIAGAGRRRQREFAAGRWHARRALAALGFDAGAPLPRQSDGSPAWPRGAVGSIAHAISEADVDGPAHAVAAVAPVGAITGLGIDVEAPRPVPPHAWARLLTDAELAHVLELTPPRRMLEVRALWCAREAALKAMRPAAPSLDRVRIVRPAWADDGGDPAGWPGVGPVRFDACIGDAPGAAWTETATGDHGRTATPAETLTCTGRVLHHRGWTLAAAFVGAIVGVGDDPSPNGPV